MSDELDFTSYQKLKRSILKKYPTLTPEQQEATFQDQKKYVGHDLEGYLEAKYEEYKKSL